MYHLGLLSTVSKCLKFLETIGITNGANWPEWGCYLDLVYLDQRMFSLILILLYSFATQSQCYPNTPNLADSGQSSPEIHFTSASSFFIFLFRRRREKLQAHLKESRTLKNYTANSLNALDAKMRAPNTNLQMHEVTTAVFLFSILTLCRCLL